MVRENITVIIGEAALEPVPPEIYGHPEIRKSAARRGKRPPQILLDISLHYRAMRRLPDREKRGRPDITHLTLLELLSSPLNIAGRLKVLIHTYGDYGIEVDPAIRLPRNYNRFVGLMEQLFEEGSVPPGSESPLMKVFPATIEGVVKLAGSKDAILLSERGKYRRPAEICEEALETGRPIIIGGFPHGEFSEETKAVAASVYSIYLKPLDAWVVASRIAYACEKYLGIME